MKEQNFNNHARMVPLYHYYSTVILLAILIGSVINLFHTSEAGVYSASLITALTVLTGLSLYFSRSFALKAQDRAIRSEENLRSFIMTGKPHDSRLTIQQIIALRFAGDDEFVALSKRAADENLSPKTIKENIRNWKPDYNRA